MKTLVYIFLFLILTENLFANNELINLDFIPHYSVINSSCLADDNAAILLNPAGLYLNSRLNATISSRDGLGINYLGTATVFPIIGVLGASLYNIPLSAGNYKRGISVGWGKEIFEFLSIGISLKTTSRNLFDFSEGIFGDVGILFFPNKNLGIKILDNPMINDRLFFGLVIQNIGKNSTTAGFQENFNLRLGISYDFQEIWTKFFVEEKFFSGSYYPLLGLEINPSLEYLKWLCLSVSYDWSSFRFGASIKGEDFSVDASYILSNNSYFIALNGYFERSRNDMAVEQLEEGLGLYQEAVKLESVDDDDSFDKYKQALDRFNVALSYNKNNQKVLYYKNHIEDKFTSYLSNFISKANNYENKKDYLNAILYYKRTLLIQDSQELTQKINDMMTNSSLLAFVSTKRKSIRHNIDNKQYMTAKKDIELLLKYYPDNNGELANDLKEVERKLSDNIQTLYSQAQVLFNNKNYDDCIDKLSVLLSIEPKMDKGRNMMYLAKKARNIQKDTDRAKTELKNKNYITAYEIVSSILLRNPDSDELSDLKLKIVKILKENLKANLSGGISFYDNSSYEKAIVEFNKVLIADPNNSVALDYKNRALSKIKAIKKMENLDQ